MYVCVRLCDNLYLYIFERVHAYSFFLVYVFLCVYRTYVRCGVCLVCSYLNVCVICGFVYACVLMHLCVIFIPYMDAL